LDDSADPDRMRRHVERLGVLYEASKRFAEGVTAPAELLQTIARTCAETLGELATIQIIQEGGEYCDTVAIHHTDPAMEREFRAFASTSPIRVGDGSMGPTIRDGTPLFVPTIDLEKFVASVSPAYQEFARRMRPSGIIGAAMRARGRILGGIALTRGGDAPPFTRDDLELLQDLSDRAALAYDNARLYADLERRVADATAELATENRRVQAASRLKSEFMANMSHELRTPLNAIIGFGDLLRDGEVGPLTEQQREFASNIVTSGRHLLQLINDVLDLSKIEAGKTEFRPEPVELRVLVDEVVMILRSPARARRVALTARVEAISDVVLDPARFKQVLYNYISNAIKFTRAGGRVEARILAEGAAGLRVEVEDTGIGIAEADLPRLFVEFQQLDTGDARMQGGTGLGLALTRRLVEAQGGVVGVHSTLGRGSVFHAVMPRRPDTTIAPPALPLIQTQRPDGRPRVLVVEDTDADRAAITLSLEAAGYAVDSAGTVAAAIQLCSRERYDAVTLDLILPDGSGLEVLRHVRGHDLNRHAEVVVLTVVAEAGAVAGFAVSEFLNKPVEPAALIAALARTGIDGGGPTHGR
jgi:signal transduction histidine kinase/ActR/RegA family two-component response regulator